MPDLELLGLDAQNPLGFFASLGLLRVLDAATKEGLPKPRLSFAEGALAYALLRTDFTRPELERAVLLDADHQAASLALGLAYGEDGRLCAPSSPDATRDLKPSPAAAREFLTKVAEAPRRDADLAAAFFSELVQDNNGNTKPTAFHFTAGQQTFLAMVEALRTGLDLESLREALDGPWRNSSALPSLSWDATVARQYALRASNPSSEKRGSVPAANWLAVQGLAFFPVMPRRGRLWTSCVRGGWKDSVFTWPVWHVPATARTVGALLRSDARDLTARERHAMGIGIVFASNILRTDQGGYGSFSPADAVVPAPSRATR